ncbi:MAG TPA: hypothetical protein VFE31_09090, partial [Opitutaceae bacterium]|nr:hypothetical protein [Opitutaceae bacterium]
MQTHEFAVRGFEICSNERFQTAMWRWKALDRALAMMRRLEFNTLIFHQNTLTDWAVLPRRYFPPAATRARWPIRCANVANGRSHLREVVRRARAQGAEFFLEVKEMSYPDELIELHPELMVIKGVVCPTHPFWWDYQRAKYTELLEDIPDIGGVLVSPGTRESKLSLSVHNCTCERCRNTRPEDWYANILRSMYEPLAAKGKKLVVRDFAYSREEQNLIMDACSRVSPDIVAALKNTPHDFYPPFPDNPRIGHVGPHPQWIEFDTWGNYFAFGFFPVSVVEDMQRRLRHAKAAGAIGAMFRTDLEFISDASDFNSWDLVNVFGAGLLTQCIERPLPEVYRAWLQYGAADHMRPESEQPPAAPVDPAKFDQFMRFLRASWNVMEKTLYVRGFVFAEGSCQFPFNVDRAFFNMLIFQGRDDWEPGASRRIEPTPENLAAVFAEKDAAVAGHDQLLSILDLPSTGLPPALQDSFRTMMDLYRYYSVGFAHCARVCFTAKRLETTRDPADAEAVRRAIAGLQDYRGRLERRLEGTYYPHYV